MTMKIACTVLVLLVSTLCFGADPVVGEADTLFDEPSIGSALKISREIDITNDSVPEILRIETTKAATFGDVKVRLSIYSKGKRIYNDEWRADDYFEERDSINDTVKWWRLQKILSVYFANENFLSSDDPRAPGYQNLDQLFADVHPADIAPGSPEAEEFIAKPHRVFHIYAGRDNLYALTYIGSKKNFLKLWRN